MRITSKNSCKKFDINLNCKVSYDKQKAPEPYAQMEFYFRAMHGAFVNPYARHIPNQVSMSNWKFSEIASRSSEEDSASYQYVDPRDISTG